MMKMMNQIDMGLQHPVDGCLQLIQPLFLSQILLNQDPQNGTDSDFKVGIDMNSELDDESDILDSKTMLLIGCNRFVPSFAFEFLDINQSRIPRWN